MEGVVLYEGLRSWEAAERLNTTSSEMYRLLFAGEIAGGPARDGVVRFPEAEVERLVKEGVVLPPPHDDDGEGELRPVRRTGYEGLTSVEAAERLGIRADEVYHLLFTGKIDGGPDIYGQVRFPESEVSRLAEHGVPTT